MRLFNTRPRVVGVLAVLALVSGCGEGAKERERRLDELAIQRLEEQKTPQQRAVDSAAAADKAKQQAMRNRLVGIVKAMRLAAKNPKSFELVSIVHVEKTDAACVTYRGTNSFNAVVTEDLAVNASGKQVDWNANCAKQKASDWTKSVLAAL